MHEEIKCNKVEGTELQYDRISYMYECPICKKQHRYAEPNENEYVFCIGDDFGLFIPEPEIYVRPPFKADPAIVEELREYFTEYEEIINEDITD